jgi:hypothetical protein
MDNKDLAIVAALAKSVGGGGGSPIPEPVMPSKPNSRCALNGIVSTENNKSYRALLTHYQIQVTGKSDGTYNVASVGSRTSPTTELLSFFKWSASALTPMVGVITMVLSQYKPDGSHPTNNITVRLKMSDYKSLSDSIELYFPYESLYNDHLFKGYFIITVTEEAYSCEYVSLSQASGGLPDVTTADNDKVLKVVDGNWAVAPISKSSPMNAIGQLSLGTGTHITFTLSSGFVLADIMQKIQYGQDAGCILISWQDDGTGANHYAYCQGIRTFYPNDGLRFIWYVPYLNNEKVIMKMATCLLDGTDWKLYG